MPMIRRFDTIDATHGHETTSRSRNEYFPIETDEIRRQHLFIFDDVEPKPTPSRQYQCSRQSDERIPRRRAT